MNNEPIAWMDDLSFFTKKPEDMDGVVALYAHPVKELTDEEIADLIANKVTDSEIIKQALRKAQEK
jgi:hypothetical protein